MLGRACNTLVAKIFDGAKTLIARADPDSAAELLQNIVLTGGGSQIRNIAAVLEKMLEDDGYAQPKVGIIGENFKEYVAKGALKAAHHAKDRQWQNLIR
jgi:rod shape-determining protein MreB